MVGRLHEPGTVLGPPGAAREHMQSLPAWFMQGKLTWMTHSRADHKPTRYSALRWEGASEKGPACPGLGP